MIGFGTVLMALIVVGLPVIMLMVAFNRFFTFREKKLEVDARMTAEKAAQYAARTHELEQRVQVLEQIVTDRGVETASQIDALRARPRRIASKRKDATA